MLRIIDIVTNACVTLAACCVGCTTLAYCAEVVARYWFNAPLNFSADIGSYLLCLGVFMALPKVTAEGAHPSISFVVDRLQGQARARYSRGLILVTAAVLAAATWFAATKTFSLYQQGTLTPLSNQVPAWWLTAIVTVGLSLSLLNLLVRPRIEPELIIPEI